MSRTYQFVKYAFNAREMPGHNPVFLLHIDIDLSGKIIVLGAKLIYK